MLWAPEPPCQTSQRQKSLGSPGSTIARIALSLARRTSIFLRSSGHMLSSRFIHSPSQYGGQKVYQTLQRLVGTVLKMILQQRSSKKCAVQSIHITPCFFGVFFYELDSVPDYLGYSQEKIKMLISALVKRTKRNCIQRSRLRCGEEGGRVLDRSNRNIFHAADFNPNAEEEVIISYTNSHKIDGHWCVCPCAGALGGDYAKRQSEKNHNRANNDHLQWQAGPEERNEPVYIARRDSFSVLNVFCKLIAHCPIYEESGECDKDTSSLEIKPFQAVIQDVEKNRESKTRPGKQRYNVETRYQNKIPHRSGGENRHVFCADEHMFRQLLRRRRPPKRLRHRCHVLQLREPYFSKISLPERTSVSEALRDYRPTGARGQAAGHIILLGHMQQLVRRIVRTALRSIIEDFQVAHQISSHINLAAHLSVVLSSRRFSAPKVLPITTNDFIIVAWRGAKRLQNAKVVVEDPRLAHRQFSSSRFLLSALALHLIFRFLRSLRRPNRHESTSCLHFFIPFLLTSMLIRSPTSPSSAAQLGRHGEYVGNRKDLGLNLEEYVGSSNSFVSPHRISRDRKSDADSDAYVQQSGSGQQSTQAASSDQTEVCDSVHFATFSAEAKSLAYQQILHHAKQALKLKDAAEALESAERCRDALILLAPSATENDAQRYLHEQITAAAKDCAAKQRAVDVARTELKDALDITRKHWDTVNSLSAGREPEQLEIVLEEHPSQDMRKRLLGESESRDSKRMKSEESDCNPPAPVKDPLYSSLESSSEAAVSTPPRSLCKMFNQLGKTLADDLVLSPLEGTCLPPSDDNQNFLLNVLEAAGPSVSLEWDTTSEPTPMPAFECPRSDEEKQAALAFVYDCLEKMEGIFTMKARVYQTYLKAYLPEPSADRQRYILNIEHPPR
eukprot:284816748_2